MTDTLIEVENISKKFCRSLKQSLFYGLKDLGHEITGCRRCEKDKLRPGEFWALNDINFEVKRGECLGLVGKNGAGKTTLLRMLNGLLKPDRGQIKIFGRVGAIIALGAGFNPVLTGKENIYVNASVLGLNNREINNKLEEIIDFAELNDFIDSPVQTYSSGMQVRLGFAIATALSPDILILDEILAVGDSTFRQKCLHRISKLLLNTAVIFVSHNASEMLRICTSGILLNNGISLCYGDIKKVLDEYHKLHTITTPKRTDIFDEGISLRILPINNKVIEFGDPFTLNIQYAAARSFLDCLTVLTFSDENAHVLQCHKIVSILSGIGRMSLHVPFIPLGNGSYRISLTIMEFRGKSQVATCLNIEDVILQGHASYGVPNQMPLNISFQKIECK